MTIIKCALTVAMFMVIATEGNAQPTIKPDMQATQTKQVAFPETVPPGNYSDFIKKISNMICDNKTPYEIEKLCEEWIMGSTNIHMMKKILIEVTYNLLRAKTQETENILKE